MRPDRGQYEGTTLRDHLRVVRRRKWIILLTVVLVPFAAVYFSLRQTPVYEASSDVLLSRQNVAASLTGFADPTPFYLPERVAQTQAALARVPAVADRVVRAADLPNVTPGGLLAASSVVPSQDSDILGFRVRDTVPSVAVKLATEYANQYTKYRSELDSAVVIRAREEVSDRLRQLEVDGERDSELYATLIEKEQQLRTIEALQTSSALLVRPAVSAYQVQPRPIRNGVLALLVGLVMGVGLAFLREALDTRVRSTEEIEHLGLPLLGRLPEPPRRVRTKDRLAMLVEPNGIHAEAFRMLKTNLEFMNLEKNARTIVVTSAIEAEGKSTTVANLAVAFARAGTHVALVDLDLRRPILDRFFRLGGRPGLTQVALGRASLDEALVPISISSRGGNGAVPSNGKPLSTGDGLLEVLASGPIPPDPGEFVGTQALAEILAALRERADLVLIDAPPLLHVGDTRALSARVDGMVLVTRLKVLRRPMIKELQRALEVCPAHKLGFVLTGSQAEEGYGYRSYYYRSSKREKALEEEPVA